MTISFPISFALALAALPGLAQVDPSPPGATGADRWPGKELARPDTGAATDPRAGLARCSGFTGLRREQCLRDVGAARRDGTRPPPVERAPLVEPPPQNPRNPR